MVSGEGDYGGRTNVSVDLVCEDGQADFQQNGENSYKQCNRRGSENVLLGRNQCEDFIYRIPEDCDSRCDYKRTNSDGGDTLELPVSVRMFLVWRLE